MWRRSRSVAVFFPSLFHHKWGAKLTLLPFIAYGRGIHPPQALEKDERLRKMEVAEAKREIRLRELEDRLSSISHPALVQPVDLGDDVVAEVESMVEHAPPVST